MERYFQSYYFVNVSRQTCVVAGFPGVHYLDRNERPMPHHTSRGGGFGGFPKSYRPVSLPPGGKATFQLSAYDYDVTRNRNCPNSTFLAVFSPDNTDRIVIPDRATVCGDTVAISPLRPFRAEDANNGG